MTTKTKLPWSGLIVSIQPRIRLMRSYDERSHSYLGYVLKLHGRLGDQEQDFAVGIGQGAHEKHRLRRGDVVEGVGVLVGSASSETVDLYKVSKLRFLERDTAEDEAGPPWHTLAPPLLVYRSRGHRRLDAGRYASSCGACVWGCEMAVETIPDHWKPDGRKYSRETFCYGPLSCRLYKAGPKRKVQGRKPGMVYVEEDWVDADQVAHRGPDD